MSPALPCDTEDLRAAAAQPFYGQHVIGHPSRVSPHAQATLRTEVRHMPSPLVPRGRSPTGGGCDDQLARLSTDMGTTGSSRVCQGSADRPPLHVSRYASA